MELMGSLFPDEQDFIQVSKLGDDLASDLKYLVHLGKVVIGLSREQYNKLMVELAEVDDVRA